MTHWKPKYAAGKAAPQSRQSIAHTPTNTAHRNGGAVASKVDEAADTLLTTSEAARILRLSPRSLERMRVDGTGPIFRKLGPGLRARVVYRLSDVKAWIESFGFQSTSEYER